MGPSTRAKIFEELKDRRRRGEARGAQGIVETLKQIGDKELKESGVFLIPGFAKFVVVKKPGTKARKAKNPSTGKTVFFKAKPARTTVRVLRVQPEPDATKGHRKKASPSAARARAALPEGLFQLEIRALADRVFGDEQKAAAWFDRPNAALSGQIPAELLTDELGAAVVREALERIDHGIFA